jgi:signal transduction histidine kinase
MDEKRSRWNRIGIKLPLVFLLIGFIAPTLGIGYFYLLSSSLLSPSLPASQQTMLEGAVVSIVVLMAVDVGILGLLISRSFTKPVQNMYEVACALEKGDFDARATVSTRDELAQLAEAFNRCAQALGRMDLERAKLDTAKSEFLSITSHELRTPITPLKAQLQMLQQGYFGPLTDKQQESLTIVLRNADRLNKIVEDFLEISRIEAARLKFAFRSIDLRETIAETVDLMRAFAQEKGITIEIHAQTLPTLEADPDRVTQVLRNLLHNAVKFSPEQSTVSVSARPAGAFIQISVRDHGVGLSAEDQTRIFEPFYQVEKAANRKYGGTGLGLTICRGIVEAQKGRLWVESTPGVGSTFHFTVPLTPVRDIEPITVLFSSQADIEERLEEGFTTMLGPMGAVEFAELRQRHALGREDVLAYITTLEGQSILRPAQAEEFRVAVQRIFGQVPGEVVEDRGGPHA